MIIEVNELDFMGFHLENVKHVGWKIVLQGVEFLFPTLQDAQMACKQFRDIVKENNGKVVVPERITVEATEKDDMHSAFQRDLLRHLLNAKTALDGNHTSEAKLILSSLIEDTKEEIKQKKPRE